MFLRPYTTSTVVPTLRTVV